MIIVKETNNFDDFSEFDSFEFDDNDAFVIFDINEKDYSWLETENFIDTIKEIIENRVQLQKYDLVKKIMEKLQENNENSFYINMLLTNNISSEFKYKLISDEKDINKIIKIVSCLSVEETNQFLINDNRALQVVEIKGINSFLTNKIPVNILDSDIVFSQLLNEKSLTRLRCNINKIEQHNNTNILERKLKKYYNQILKCILTNQYDDMKEMFSYYNNDAKVVAKNIFFNYLFEDSMENVLINLNEMFRYQSNEKNLFMSKSNLDFYKKVLSIDNLDAKEIVNMIYTFSTLNITSMFYDDIRLLKDDSYKKIVHNLYKPNEKNINSELSNKFGIDVYELNGEDFNMMIRVTSDINPTTLHKFDCYSLIGSKNISHFHYASYDEDLIFGFCNLNYQNISGVLEKDSMTKQEDGSKSMYVNRIMTSKEIIEGDESYSEINIQNNIAQNEKEFNTIKPDFIVAYDEITESISKAAKKYSVPIVIINSKKYINQITSTFESPHQYDREQDLTKMKQQINMLVDAMANGQLDEYGQPLINQSNNIKYTRSHTRGFIKIWVLGVIIIFIFIMITILFNV